MKKCLLFTLVTFFMAVNSFSQTATHLNFDGVNDRIQVPSGINIANSSFTLEFYAKRTLSNTNDYVFNQGSFLTNNNLHIGFRDNNNFLFAFYNNDLNISATNYISDNEWHHWSCVYNVNDGSRVVYQDGIVVGSQTGVTPFAGSGVFQIASQNSQHFFDGNLDEIRVWNVARTAEQINGSRNCELQGTETGLVAYYKFNQGIDAADNTAITSLTDATANANNGTLVNFTKTGTTSNFLAGSPVTTGSIIPSVATVTTPVTYNQGATATALTATTGTNGSGLLWYTAATGGTGATIAPTPSTATVGSTSYWVSSTNANGCESARTEIVVTVNVLATHLNFDGVNDFIALPNEANFDFTNQMTVEAWVKSNVAPEQWDALVIKGDNSWRLHLNSTGTVNFTCSGTTSSQVNSTSSVTDGNWHHVVGTLGGNSIKIYIDGVLENVVATSGNINNTVDQVLIGNNPTFGPRHFNGNLDEIRVWNVARTAEQINGSRNCELQGTETGLVAYYKFNQGIDAADNTAITSLTDATANANNGTLVNFTKTGTTSNFLAGSPVTIGSIVPSNATVTTPVVYTQGDTATELTATTGANGSNLLWYTTATGGTGTTAPTPSTATVGSTSYWVSSTNANGCESARTEIVVTVNASIPATHLNFDGVDNRVELSNESNFDFTSTFSMEAWIRVTSFTQEWQTVISKGAEGPRIHRFGFTNFIAFGTGPANDLVSTVSFNDGNWHHIAATCNNGFKSLYVDGVLQGTQTVGTPLITNNDNVRIGSQIDAYTPIRAFHGDIDEVRIWNKALTASDITNTMNCELQSAETGLVAYYKFNQGNGSADNTTITTLTDSSGNANNGTLTNFTLTGTTSNWLAGSPITTGNTCTVLTLSTSNFEVANNIKMYPNPTNGIFTIETQEDSTVEVFDMIGKKVYSNKVSVGSSTIDLSNYTNGIYLLTVTNQKGNLNTFKLIKQ